jgi:hypothetical protein
MRVNEEKGQNVHHFCLVLSQIDKRRAYVGQSSVRHDNPLNVLLFLGQRPSLPLLPSPAPLHGPTFRPHPTSRNVVPVDELAGPIVLKQRWGRCSDMSTARRSSTATSRKDRRCTHPRRENSGRSVDALFEPSFEVLSSKLLVVLPPVS